jgi:hypothetical protein
MRTSPLAAALLAVALAPSLTACDEEDGSFATTAPADRNLIIYAATGDLAMGTTWFVAQLAASAERTGSACPRATRTGSDLTITGSCTTADGTAIEGSATVRGFAWDTDGNVDLTGVELHDFRYGADGLGFDGDIAVTLHDGGAYDLRQDVQISTSRFSVMVEGPLTCTGENAACAPGESYTVRVDAIGTATVGGAWLTAPGAATGTIALSADDTLAVDFATRDADGCFAATLDGAATDPICFADGRR